MMKVLLATDGSDQATTAFRTASRLLRRENSEFDLLCVAPEFYFPKGKAGKTATKTARMVEAYDRRIRVEARQHLTQAPAPGTSALEAIMRQRKVGCLPVVENDRLVGIVTAYDFLSLAAEIIEEQLGGLTVSNDENEYPT
jgi:CBS domain/Universal stress protein family